MDWAESKEEGSSKAFRSRLVGCKAKEGKRHLDSRKKTTKIIMKYGRPSERRDGGK